MKLRLVIIYILWSIMLAVSVAMAQTDSATVRIVVDLGGVTLTMNGDTVSEDSFGNPLTASASFILSVEPGEYYLSFSHPDHPPVTRVLVVAAGEVNSLRIIFIETEVEPGEAVLKISSLPDSAEVLINGQVQAGRLPLQLDVATGKYTIELIRAGYEPLTHELTIEPSKTYSLEFYLKPFPPLVQTAKGLGLQRAILETPLDVGLADRKMKKYSSLAEAFAVIPFGQGVMAKLILDEKDSQIADILLISGAALTLGSYVVGMIVAGKERRYLVRENERITRDNEVSKTLNRDIDLSVRQVNQDAINLWEAQCRDAGRVKVSITEHSPDRTTQ